MGTDRASDEPTDLMEVAANAAPAALQESSKKTAAKAVQLLIGKGEGFHEPNGVERRALAVGFAMGNKVLYGKAFDLVRVSRPVNLSDPTDIAAKLDVITVYEVKSTNRVLPADFRGYFFALTTAELLVAQSLGERYRFAFVDTTTEAIVELSMPEVFARARKIYPTWSIMF